MVLLPLVMEYYKWWFLCLIFHWWVVAGTLVEIVLYTCSSFYLICIGCLHILYWDHGAVAELPGLQRSCLQPVPGVPPLWGGVRGALYVFLHWGPEVLVMPLPWGSHTRELGRIWELGSLSGVRILFTNLWLFPLVGAHPRVRDVSGYALPFFQFLAVMYLWACLRQQAMPLMMFAHDKTHQQELKHDASTPLATAILLDCFDPRFDQSFCKF